MSKRLVLSALAQFTAKTAGRNMTKAAYAAVAAGVAAMVVLTVATAYEVAHHWVDAVLGRASSISCSNGWCGCAMRARCSACGYTHRHSAAWWTPQP